MKRLNIVRNLLITGVLALGLSSITGCALENSSSDPQGSSETGTDDLVEGASDDPTVVHSGTSGGAVLQLTPGSSIRSAPPVLENPTGGPQPEPWRPEYAIHATSTNGSSSNK